MFNREGAPHLIVTGIDPGTQGNPVAVAFDYQSVYDREDTYRDVAGFYHTHPSGMNAMSSVDIETMTQWVNCLGKNLVCLIETEQRINGWLFTKDKTTGKVTYQEINVDTPNDVHYDLWISSSGTFWSAVDFLTDGEFEDYDDDDDTPSIFDDIESKLTALQAGQQELGEKFSRLVMLLQQLMIAVREKNE